MRASEVISLLLAILLLAGCGEKKDTKEGLAFAKSATETLTGVKLDQLDQVRSDVMRLKESLEKEHWEDFKALCTELDKRFNQRILTWYAEVLLVEQTRGPDAAREVITRLKAQDKLSEKDVKGLIDIEGYFKNKGEMSTLRLALTFYAVYLEAEYGHGASALVGGLLEATAKKVQPDGAANGSQPIRSETNSTSSAAGSRR